MPNRSIQGFTLLEMLVAVVMVGIMTAIALPNFLGQTNRSRTTEATAVLSAIASGQGEFRFRNPGQYFQVGAAAPAFPAAGVTTFVATATRGVAIGIAPNQSNAAAGEAVAFAQTLGVDVGVGTAGDRWRFAAMPRDAAGAVVANGNNSVDFTISAYGITNANGQQTGNLGTMLVNSRGLAQPVLDTNADN